MSFELVHLCSAVFEPLEESCFSIADSLVWVILKFCTNL